MANTNKEKENELERRVYNLEISITIIVNNLRMVIDSLKGVIDTNQFTKFEEFIFDSRIEDKDK